MTTDHANVCSTIHRLGSTQIHQVRSLTICNLQAPVRHTVIAILRPAYPRSAKMRPMNGNNQSRRRSKWKAPSRSEYRRDERQRSQETQRVDQDVPLATLDL